MSLVLISLISSSCYLETVSQEIVDRSGDSSDDVDGIGLNSDEANVPTGEPADFNISESTDLLSESDVLTSFGPTIPEPVTSESTTTARIQRPVDHISSVSEHHTTQQATGLKSTVPPNASPVVNSSSNPFLVSTSVRARSTKRTVLRKRIVNSWAFRVFGAFSACLVVVGLIEMWICLCGTRRSRRLKRRGKVGQGSRYDLGSRSKRSGWGSRRCSRSRSDVKPDGLDVDQASGLVVDQPVISQRSRSAPNRARMASASEQDLDSREWRGFDRRWNPQSSVMRTTRSSPDERILRFRDRERTREARRQ